MPERRLIRPTALKRLKETYRDDKGVVLPHLERHVMKTVTDARPDDHSMQHMHPSDMAKPDWCPRHDYYRILGTPTDKTSKQNPSFRMSNIWSEGTAIHTKYQHWLWEMGVLWGDWSCVECGHRWGALSPSECQFCKSARIQYRELPMQHRPYMVEGHADAAVHNLDGWSGLVEIKSIGVNSWRFDAPLLWNRYRNGESAEDIWFTIKRPFATHMRQGQLYLWMLWPRYEQISFIYESKFHQQTKEFVVQYNKDLILPQIEGAKDVAQGVRAGITPERPHWAEDAAVKVCAACEYRRTCWQLGAPNGATPDQTDTPAVIVKRGSSYKRRRALRSS